MEDTGRAEPHRQTMRRWAALPVVAVPLGVLLWPKAFLNVEMEAAIGSGLQGLGLQPRKAEQLAITPGPVAVAHAT